MGTTESMRRGVWIALVAYALFAAILLLSPFSPGEIVAWVTGLVQRTPGLGFVRQGWMEFGLNVLLFLPLGLLLTLSFRHLWFGAVVAIAISVGAELVQAVLPNRVASPRDVLANALGALIGAAIAWLIIRRHRLARPTATTRAR